MTADANHPDPDQGDQSSHGPSTLMNLVIFQLQKSIQGLISVKIIF